MMTYRRAASRIIYTIQLTKNAEKKLQKKRRKLWISLVSNGPLSEISISAISRHGDNIGRQRESATNKNRVSLKRIDKPRGSEIRSNDQPQNGHDKCRRAKQEFQFAPRTWLGCRLTKIPRFLHGSPSAWTNLRPVEHVRNICDFRCVLPPSLPTTTAIIPVALSTSENSELTFIYDPRPATYTSHHTDIWFIWHQECWEDVSLIIQSLIHALDLCMWLLYKHISKDKRISTVPIETLSRIYEFCLAFSNYL